MTPETLSKFILKQVINEDPITHSLNLLGTLPSPESDQLRVQAIVRIEKTALDIDTAPFLFASGTGSPGLIQRIHLGESTDIYSWFFGWFGENRGRDVKITVICPATDVHVRKYTRQESFMVQETPELYEQIVKPYIASFPPSRTQWVEAILSGVSEQDKILHSSPDFVILPDMKWDLTTLSSLYLVAIVQDRTIRSLRDLRKRHIPLLRSIRDDATRIARKQYGLAEGSLRMFIHYQPSYYHFHVHIVNVNYAGLMGMVVGQAHLLDDVISLLELENEDGPGIFEQMTVTYRLGDQHSLYEAMKARISTLE
ncbi:hypothetical protein APHAL10511_008326 [Amanita phalloides]|nr:hypothetical protein APHAL10511_008326 [Amanita phalloides]